MLGDWTGRGDGGLRRLERERYQIYDVTSSLEPGANAVGAIVGDGWYRGRLGFRDQRNRYGRERGLLAQLEIEYEDGTIAVVASDAAWRARTGPILASSLYDGERHDARLEPEGWSRADRYIDGWTSVATLERDLSTLVGATGPPVRRTQLVEPREIRTSPNGRTIVDFGQNVVGRVRLRVRGQAGQTVTIRHAEVLEAGELCVWPLRDAAATDTYVLAGSGVETWEPRFTFHGFRCAEISGWAGAPTACFLYDCAGFLTSWLADLAAEQAELGGRVPNVVPDALPDVTPAERHDWDAPAAGWGDAAVIVPWVLYQRTGDRRVLAAQFASMAAWVDHVASLAGPTRLWDRGFQFGDWLDPTAPANKPDRASTDPSLVATAYFARSSELVAEIAAVLG